MLIGVFAVDPYERESALRGASILEDVPEAKKLCFFTRPRRRVVTVDLRGWRMEDAEALVFYELPDSLLPEVKKRVQSRLWTRAFHFPKLPDRARIEAFNSLFRVIEEYGGENVWSKG